MTPPSEDYRIIPLTRGLFTKVSPHRYEELSRFKWHAHPCGDGTNFYAARFDKALNRKLMMHREILGIPFGDKRRVDHADRDHLNNVDGNLREASHAQNMHNTKVSRKNASGYKGVSWLKHIQKYAATICVNGHNVALGYRSDPHEAHLLYVAAAKRLRGDFARWK